LKIDRNRAGGEHQSEVFTSSFSSTGNSRDRTEFYQSQGDRGQVIDSFVKKINDLSS